MSEKKDITFHVDETWRIDCSVAGADGAPIVVEEAEWRMASATARLVKVAVGDGIVLTGPGELTVTVPLERQTGIVAGTYDHELWVKDAATHDGSIQITGRVLIVASLKRRFP